MPSSRARTAAVIGAGPAGLMAAEAMAKAGIAVTIYDSMPSPARKFLMAGRGGLNLTHTESLDPFLARYHEAAAHLEPFIRAFSPDDLRLWSADLGQPTFAGTSGRVFPQSFKASPLLRAWLRRLDALGVVLRTRHRFEDFDASGAPVIRNLEGERAPLADAYVFALGGASWPKLGSNGSWLECFRAKGLSVRAFMPANCGFLVAWSDVVSARFAGAPLKPLRLSFAGTSVRGEAMISHDGIEGGAIYALSSLLRDAIETHGEALLQVDLHPDLSHDALAAKLARPRGSQSGINFLRKATGLSPAALGLLREPARDLPQDPVALAALIKNLPLRLHAAKGLERAISSAGGLSFDELDDGLMLRKCPGIFICGEMLDWEAPTGGYLLQACFASGHAAGQAAARWLAVSTS